MNSNTALSALRVVMVETTLPANIGSAARAMMTCAIPHLALVNPKNPIDATSYAAAKGGKPILDEAVIYPTLPAALAECSLVIAASSRSRHLPRPIITINQACTLIDTFIVGQTLSPTIALVFGREDRGLTNDELSLADYHLQLDANPAYPVLNVASSIQVIGSFLYNHFAQKHPSPQKTDVLMDIAWRTHWDSPAITHQQKQILKEQIIALMSQLELAKDDELKDLPSRIARLNSRLQLDQKEYALIMALLATLFKRLPLRDTM